jgi:hypothetical protein
MAEAELQISAERIASRIYLIRGQQVLLDEDLAQLYGVPTGRLNEQVSRNRERFPEDFMFRLDDDEFTNLRSQTAISSWGGRRYAPRVFTQEGVAMLSSVLRSRRAIQVNIAIMRTFVRLREVLAGNRELARRVARHDQQIALLFQHVKGLLEPSRSPKKNPIGYCPPDD